MKRNLPVLLLLFAAVAVAAQSGSQSPSVQPGMGQANTAASPGATQAPVDPAKSADIRRFLDASGARTVMAPVMNHMLTTLKPLLTSALPAGEYRDKLVNLLFERFQSKANLDQLLDLLIPIYDKHFSDQEIKDLTTFYETPLGQKAASVLPQIATEAQAVGGQWGEKMGRECMKEVLAENPDLAAQLNAAVKAGAAAK